MFRLFCRIPVLAVAVHAGDRASPKLSTSRLPLHLIPVYAAVGTYAVSFSKIIKSLEFAVLWLCAALVQIEFSQDQFVWLANSKAGLFDQRFESSMNEAARNLTDPWWNGCSKGARLSASFRRAPAHSCSSQLRQIERLSNLPKTPKCVRLNATKSMKTVILKILICVQGQNGEVYIYGVVPIPY